MIQAEITPVIGKSSLKNYPQVLRNIKGNLVCSIVISGQACQSMGSNFAQAFDKFNPQSAIELNKILVESLQKLKQSNCEVHLSCGLFVNDKAIFAAYKGVALLKRDNRVGKILSSEEELKIIEGECKKEDLVVLLTEQASIYINNVSAQLSQNLSVSVIVNKLVPNLYSQQDSSLSAIVFVSPILKNINENNINNDLTNNEFKKEDINLITKKSKIDQEKGTIKKKKIKINLKLVSVILLILITAGGAGGYYYLHTKKAAQRLDNLQQQLEPIKKSLSEAQNIKDEDQISAREKTDQVIKELESLTNQYQSDKNLLPLIEEEKNKAKNFAQTITGKEEIEELTLFFDLKLVDSDFIATTADLDGENIYFLDTSKNQVIRLNLEKKQSQILPIGEQSSLKDLAVGEKYIYLLGEGLLKYDKSGEFPTVEIKNDDSIANKQTQILKNFGPFLYVFNSENKNIFRVDSEDEESATQTWFNSENGLDFDEVRSITIDGDIWLTTKTGEIKKFSQGTEQEFNITGLDDPFSSPTVIFTKDNLSHLYILEPNKKRVVILTKKGEFLREIKSQSLSTTTTLIVSEEKEKIYALSGSVIYEINL